MKFFNYFKLFIGIKLNSEPKKKYKIIFQSKKPSKKPSKKILESDSNKLTYNIEKTERIIEKTKYLTVSEAAQKHNITKQAIFFAIKMKRLSASKENNIWLISQDALKEYFDTKYCRSNSKKEGKLIFDKAKGFYSITEAADFLGKNTNNIYYLVRTGKLKSHRHGTAIIIQDVELYKYAEFTKKTHNTCTG